MTLAADQLFRIPLLPLLAAQGLLVRRNARLLPEPPGPRQGQAGRGPSLRLLVIGDSSAAGVGAPTQADALSGQLTRALARDFNVTWRLEAETGHTTRDTLARLRGLAPEPFDVVVSALGVNDVTRARSAARFRREQAELLALVTGTFGARLVIASGLPPMGNYPMLPQPLRWVLGEQAKRLDRELAVLAVAHPTLDHLVLELPFDLRFMAADGYHPSTEAYAHWAEMLARRIRARLG